MGHQLTPATLLYQGGGGGGLATYKCVHVYCVCHTASTSETSFMFDTSNELLELILIKWHCPVLSP